MYLPSNGDGFRYVQGEARAPCAESRPRDQSLVEAGFDDADRRRAGNKIKLPDVQEDKNDLFEPIILLMPRHQHHL
jgi:hypothetical protein